jgi:hypothetical protein
MGGDLRGIIIDEHRRVYFRSDEIRITQICFELKWVKMQTNYIGIVRKSLSFCTLE